MANLALMGYQAVQIVFLVRTVGATPALVGTLVMAASLGGILGTQLAGPVGRRFGTARGLLLTQLLTGPFALLLPLTTPGAGLLLFAAGAFIVTTGIVACNVVLAGFRQRYCPPHLLGRVVATTMVLNQSTVPLGSLLGGLLGDLLGLRPTMWVMAALLAPCGLLLSLGALRSRRELPDSYDAPMGGEIPTSTGAADMPGLTADPTAADPTAVATHPANHSGRSLSRCPVAEGPGGRRR